MVIRRVRRAILLPVALVALGAVGGCGLLGAPTTAGSAAVVGSPPPSPAPSSPPPSVAPATAANAASGTVPIAAPTVYTGSGDAVVPVTKPAGATTVVATITGNAAARHFYVRALDGEQDVLVQTTAPYSGSTLLDPDGGSTTKLRVWATGPWSITLSDPRSAPVFTDTYSGTGDAVVVYERPIGVPAAGQAAVTGTSLWMTMYSDGTATTLVRVAGPWSGLLRWPFRVGLVAVRAAGPWSLTVDPAP